MSIPQNCTVLVIGGGPAGSYAAAALAREGVDVVVLEAEKFPRYHIGESMLPSIRHFLRFIDCDHKWDAHGFIKKKGAAFRLNRSQPEAYTDFIAAGGPNGYAWNVIRSEADELLFKHAGESGANIFDATKIDAIQFEPDTGIDRASSSDNPNPGRPVSATWSRKDGTSGIITFKYLVDASGRQGLVSTKYLKNRQFNQGLKNIANWGYWSNGGIYGNGTHKEGSPFFEALQDASGWCWFIPLHDGTHSVGIVQNQQMATAKKRKQGSPSSMEFYMNNLNLVPGIKKLLSNGELIADVKSASDWSYSASTYAFPYVRIIGDAGCFIDPYFSSGVHLAILGGLSAAVTISAAIRGDCDETTAASWHSKKTSESYTRFFLVVSSALKQIRSQEEPVIQDIDEEGFQRAFDLFRPVIQGTVDADASGRLTQSDISNTVEFCFKAFTHVSPEQKDALVQKLKSLGLDAEADDETTAKAIDDIEKSLTPEESQVLEILRSRRMVREDGFNLDSFTLDSIDGLSPNMERGKLGLVEVKAAKLSKLNLYSMPFLEGKRPGIRDQMSKEDSKDAMNEHASTTDLMNGHANSAENTIKDGMNGSGETMNGHAKASTDMIDTGHTNGHGVEKLLEPLSGNGSALDDDTRHTLMSALHAAAENLETPVDMLMRISNTGRLLALIKVGNQLGVFKALAANATPLNVEELAKPTGADPRLVSRIMRYLAANRLVAETGKDSYTATKATEYMADPGIEGGLTFFYAVSNPTVHQLPEILEQNGFQSRTGEPVFHKAFNTNLDLYPWLKTQPEMLKSFQNMMTIPRAGDWLSAVSFAHASGSASLSNGPVFVDVGGNIGHQCARLKAAHPELAGRIILQDLEETIQEAPVMEGVSFMAHDFFTEQPVKGAQYYYLRSILHNWDDDKAVEILQRIVPAMSPDSYILIDEMVLPNTGAHVWPAGQDLQMMIMFGSMERTVDQWDDLLDRAALKAVKTTTYAPVMQTSIIFAQPK